MGKGSSPPPKRTMFTLLRLVQISTKKQCLMGENAVHVNVILPKCNNAASIIWLYLVVLHYLEGEFFVGCAIH